MDGGVITFILAILIVAVFIFVAILLTGKRVYHFNKEDYQARFLGIENKLSKDNISSFSMVIIEADKLLDKAMHEMGVPGQNHREGRGVHPGLLHGGGQDRREKRRLLRQLQNLRFRG